MSWILVKNNELTSAENLFIQLIQQLLINFQYIYYNIYTKSAHFLQNIPLIYGHTLTRVSLFLFPGQRLMLVIEFILHLTYCTVQTQSNHTDILGQTPLNVQSLPQPMSQVDIDTNVWQNEKEWKKGCQ